jgi:hypothetical protein
VTERVIVWQSANRTFSSAVRPLRLMPAETAGHPLGQLNGLPNASKTKLEAEFSRDSAAGGDRGSPDRPAGRITLKRLPLSPS